MKIPTLIACLLLAIITTPTGIQGQSRAPRLPPIVTETTPGIRIVEADFAASAPMVWSVLPLVLMDLGIEPQVDTTRVGVMGNTRILAPLVGNERLSRFASCGSDGGPGVANMYRIRLNLVIQVRPEGTGTRTYTRLIGTGRTVQGSGGDPIQCITTGRLEQRIIDDLNAQLAVYAALTQSDSTETASSP